MQKQETQEVLEEIKQENVEPVTTENVENKGDAAEETQIPVPDEKGQKIEELQNRILRLQADFDNFRRRTTKEQSQLSTFVTANVVEKFLKVLDSFERAEESMAKANDVESIRVGLEMIQRQLTQIFKELSVEEISAQGQKFDPSFHEAVMRGENAELEDETIEVKNHYFEEGTKLKITLPPDALSLAGDGNGDLTDLYIESVIYKGEHNEIILESDTRKWLMLSDTDEQVATYVPLSFDFDKAKFEVLSDKEG